MGWVKWLLTSTVLELRDLATMAVYWFGRGDPKALFDITLEFTIVERQIHSREVAGSQLRSGHGLLGQIVTSADVSPNDTPVSSQISTSECSHLMRSTPPPMLLMQDYTLGIIELALRMDSLEL